MKWNELKLSSEKFLELAIDFGSTGAMLIFIILVGYIAARLIASIARKLTVASGLDALIEKLGISRYWYSIGLHVGAAEIIARFCKWTILIATAFVAIDVLGIDTFQTVSTTFLTFIPDLAIGVALILVGLVVSEWVARALESFLEASHLIDSPEFVANAIRFVLVLAFILIGTDQMGVKIDLLRQSLLILISAVLLAATLAVGLGARNTMQNMLHGFYIRKLVRIGETIHVGEHFEGEVLGFAPQHIVLKSAGSELVINYSFCVEENFSIDKRLPDVDSEDLD